MSDENKKEEIKEILKFDALVEAERVTGKSYKKDKETESLGMMLHMIHGEVKRNILTESRDLCYSSPMAYAECVLQDLGFEEVSREAFSYTGAFDDERNETCAVWWCAERGVLAWVESYGENLNNATFYGNCKLTAEGRKYTSSGGHRPESDDVKRRSDAAWGIDIARMDLSESFSSEDQEKVTNEQIAEHLKISAEEVVKRIDGNPKPEEWIWVGSWGHEGIRSKIESIDEHGEWLTEWAERPFLWLCNHAETKKGQEYDHKAISEARIQKLPEHIQKAITPEK